MQNPEPTVAQAQTVTCPNCQAPPGTPCTQPTDTGRRSVAWVHLARQSAFSESSEGAFRCRDCGESYGTQGELDRHELVARHWMDERRG